MAENNKSYYELAQDAKKKLETVSNSMCLAKWLQVSMHLPQGLTQSCYHPPSHKISLEELKQSPKALHNSAIKRKEKAEMLAGQRPSGCEYCWNIEDAPNGPHLSDRHYRSGEWWSRDQFDEVLQHGSQQDINPRYVEVNFNQACNFKCVYCSPHLSTEWEKEVKELGPIYMSGQYGKFAHNDINALTASGLMPLKVSAKENPYVEAFWQWWPDLYKDLKVFRMTGGEPLMDKNTFKVLDYVNEHPNDQLELSITSNMCPPDQSLFEKFVSKVKLLEDVRIWETPEKINPDSGNTWHVAPACKHFSLFISLDGTGAQSEYIRTGLDYDRLLNNTRTFLRETSGTEVSFINTFSLMSIPSLKSFLEMILALRVEFGYENQKEIFTQPPDRNGFVHEPFVRKKRQRVWFDIPYIRYPSWMSIQNIASYPEVMSMLYECLDFMELNREKEDYGRTYHGFKDYEIAKLKRDIAWAESGVSLSSSELELRKSQFWKYFNSIDSRRNQNFIETFPELTTWWNDCFISSDSR